MLPVGWEAAALVLLAFRVLWLFCPQSAGRDVPQRDQNSFLSRLFQSLLLLSCTICCRGGRQVMENLPICPVQACSHLVKDCSVTIQWPSLCLKFVKLFLICFKGSGLHPLGLLTVGFGEHGSPTELRRQSGSPWSGILSWMGKSSTDFCLDTALLLSSCLGATL